MWIQGGEAWAEWYPTVRDELLKRQIGPGLLDRQQRLQRVRNGHGADHPADTQRLPADLPTLSWRAASGRSAMTWKRSRCSSRDRSRVFVAASSAADVPGSSWPSEGRAAAREQLAGRLRPRLQAPRDRRTDRLGADRLVRATRRIAGRREGRQEGSPALESSGEAHAGSPGATAAGESAQVVLLARRRPPDAGRRSARRPMRAWRSGPSCSGSSRSRWTLSWWLRPRGDRRGGRASNAQGSAVRPRHARPKWSGWPTAIGSTAASSGWMTRRSSFQVDQKPVEIDRAGAVAVGFDPG